MSDRRSTPAWALGLGLVIVCFLVMALLFGFGFYAYIASKVPRGLPPEEALAKANVNGKYSTLLSQFSVPQDVKAYNTFHDYGPYSGTSYAGYNNLPLGYWVYVYPDWYIWQNAAGVPVATARTPPASEDALTQARCNGKYAMLLRQLHYPQNGQTFYDEGYYASTSWGGHTDLPLGYWVYCYPYYYIWRDCTTTPQPKRPFGPEQATGEPNATEPAHRERTWTWRTSATQEEWLLLEYPEPVAPRELRVHVAAHAGAIFKVSVFGLDGQELVAWSGRDPIGADEDRGVGVIPLEVAGKINRVKVHFDPTAVKGAAEIDAVGLVDREGAIQWASAAEGSSTVAPPRAIVPVGPRQMEQRVAQLEEEVRQLKAALEEVRKKLPKDP